MTTLGVDLAQKMSGACIMDGQTILWQDHSMNYPTAAGFVSALVLASSTHQPSEALVEDLPFGLANMTLTRDVLRLQGRLQQGLEGICEVEFVQPQAWMLAYGINGKGSATRVAPCAAKLGYQPPVDYRLYHHQERAKIKKAGTDFAAAFLIARWGTLRLVK